jgi:CRISPR-associated protein Csb2
MAATWKRKLHADAHVNELVPLVFAKLVDPPVFSLPPAAAAHTRHFMPWYKGWKPEYPLKAKVEVFDAFVVVERDATVVASWPHVQLDEAETLVMNLILERVNYLGRAESWVDMRLVEMPDSAQINCMYEGFSHRPKPRLADSIEVIAPDPGTWNEWKYGPGSLKPDPPWNLLAETTDLHKERWSHPPGSRTLVYQRAPDALEARPVYRAPKRKPLTTARFVLDGPVLPPVTETVYVGELARQFLQGIFGGLMDRGQSEIFSGKDSSGKRLDGHGHAFFLPADEDGDGRLDHITIHSSDRFGDGELRALDQWRRVRQPGRGPEMNVMLVGLGGKDEAQAADSISLVGRAKRWRSITPFIPTRHYKKRGAKRDVCSLDEFPEIALREEIARRGLPDPVNVTTLQRCELWNHMQRAPAASRRTLSWLQFRRERVFGNGLKGAHPGCGFVIEFPEPVAGPIALGYGCHFGLGLFAPVR